MDKYRYSHFKLKIDYDLQRTGLKIRTKRQVDGKKRVQRASVLCRYKKRQE